MIGAGETARLEMFRDLLSDAHRALDLQFGFELWDGSTIPAHLPSYAMRLVIRHESVIAALVRRPNLDTALNAYVAGLLDLKNGTLFDLADQRPRGKVVRQLRGLSKLKALKTAYRFLRAPSSMPRPLAWVEDKADARDGRPQTNKRNVAFTTTCRMTSTGSFSIRRWSIPARIFSRTGTTTSPARNGTSST